MIAFQTKTIEELTDALIDYRGKTPKKSSAGIKLITAKVIKDGRIIDDNHEYISEETYASWMTRGFPTQWDILLTTEAPLGEVAQLRTPERVALAQRVILLRGKAGVIDQKYFFQALKSDFVKAELNARATGTTVLGIKQSELRQVRIPYYPLHIQCTIAGILSAYDDLIENNTRRIKLLEEMAQLLYREWFVNFRFPGHQDVPLVESAIRLIPQGWLGSLEDALVLQRGFDLPTKLRKEGNVPIYASTGITGTHNEAKIKAPGVVTGRSGSLGTVMYVDEDFWALNTTLWVKEFRRVTPIYAFYLLSNLGLEQYNAGAAVPTLNRNDIHGLSVVIPSADILTKFDNQIQPLFALKKNLLERNRNLCQARDLLLPKLISGEIDVERLDGALANNAGDVAA